MDKLEAFKILAEIVDKGSFSAAARKLRVSRSVISRNIEALEKDVGIRLLNRTTRSLSMTDAGKIYYEGVKKVLSDISAMENSVSETNTRLRGTISISSPVHFGEWWLLPVINEFLHKNPEVNIRMELDNKRQDIIQGGFDLMIRTAPHLDDSSFVARKVATNQFRLCAAEAYCARNGKPDSPTDLESHSCISSFHSGQLQWVFDSPENELMNIAITPRFTINAGSAQISAVAEGMGIALLPDYVFENKKDEAKLVELLPDYPPASYPVYIMFPHKELMPLRARKLVDAIIDAL